MAKIIKDICIILKLTPVADPFSWLYLSLNKIKRSSIILLSRGCYQEIYNAYLNKINGFNPILVLLLFLRKAIHNFDKPIEIKSFINSFIILKSHKKNK